MLVAEVPPNILQEESFVFTLGSGSAPVIVTKARSDFPGSMHQELQGNAVVMRGQG